MVTAPTPEQAGRDPQAEHDCAEWRGWMEANAYSTHPDDCEGMAEAFAAGMQAERDLDAAQGPQPVPGNAEVAYEQWIEHRDPMDVGSMAGFTAGWQTAVTAASGWPLCPNGCGCRLGSEDADARDCACDGLCCYDEIEVSEVFTERDGLRKALRAITLGITEPSPKTVAENALNGRYFDPRTDSGVWGPAADPNHEPGLSECGCRMCDPGRHGIAGDAVQALVGAGLRRPGAAPEPAEPVTVTEHVVDGNPGVKP